MEEKLEKSQSHASSQPAGVPEGSSVPAASPPPTSQSLSTLLHADDLTPAMKQYIKLKSEHPDCLLFYQMGDFYEMFFEDAETAAAVLNITLTKRGKAGGMDIPMCGVPLHASEGYLTRLIKHGYRIAICEQTETPDSKAKTAPSKALLSRDVVRVVTPGTLVEENVLVASENNYLVAMYTANTGLVVVAADISCGDISVETLPNIANTDSNASGGGKNKSKLAESVGEAIARLNPAEIIMSDDKSQALLGELITPLVASNCLHARPSEDFNHAKATQRLCALYQTASLDDIASLNEDELAAVGGLVAYLDATQKNRPLQLKPIRNIRSDAFVEIDPATRRSLELTRTLGGEKKGALLASIDKTLTAQGGRMLGMRLARPLRDASLITGRLDLVDMVLAESGLETSLTHALKGMPDIERAFSRLGLRRGGPRDLDTIATGILAAKTMGDALKKTSPKTSGKNQVKILSRKLSQCQDLATQIKRALVDTPPLLAREGSFIRLGFDMVLDEFLHMRDESTRHIAKLQNEYAEATGIASLKIRHNNVLGYHIEVKSRHADVLMSGDKNKAEFIHRQTTAQAVRFSTTRLGDLERDLAEASDKAKVCEMEWFEKLAQEVIQQGEGILALTEAVAELDVAVASAGLARDWEYCRPDIKAKGTRLAIIGGRHPVVEQHLARNKDAPFIKNDCVLDDKKRIWLLTGPNMAGKSTFLRQNALVVIMAQAGLFVPATSAEIGLVDKVFCRVGASDDLASGRSTFMVEMVETAAILNQASADSLVILDEIGRGTATYDGLSLAWAVVEHLHHHNKARVLFATHYHELAALEARLPLLACYEMLVRQWEDTIVFLHEVKAGAADRSYGIHVARLAGVPEVVIKRAEEVLNAILAEDSTQQTTARLPLFGDKKKSAQTQDKTSIAIMAELEGLDLDHVSPADAWTRLNQLKKRLDGEKK
ncbi:MAG: DNA mismatch repair protein MutS [Proteobacteria bacterium]|nr:DNA mismatch repair protein MutS [Pseudomonadota bacterium]